MFNGMLVGSLEEMPRSPGRYRYEPYRGLGHYEMQMLRRSGGSPRCCYDAGDERVSFTIHDCPEYGVLELIDFEISPRNVHEPK